ncbi:MAG: 50S ribosomal protein L25 [Candidatus Yanofskybacteria bacterium GW2011_GWA2_41_22]|uniref:50S ribosomal protein L25 n=1 Tax=Candidatus Yanofskybacteria bacterium GW2011_GWA2_41_22 TaxID=1619023 RepID=A0A0G0YLV2_9BACT|nr:MAG: 50S ribosomal protein L25 [Candidatus Yanofskybacteria bacterium GW2011_GWA2_41_22]
MPAVLYGKGQETLPLQVLTQDFSKIYKLAGESTLVYINIGDQSYPTIIHDITRDALSDELLHADFYKVRLDEKIKAMIPVVFENESSAVKDLGGIFVRNVNEMEVEGLPQELPHEIKIDISELKNFGDQILLKNVKLSAGLKLIGSEDEIIATIQEPISEEELQKSLEQSTASVEDVEVIKKEKEEETPAEEAEAPKELEEKKE